MASLPPRQAQRRQSSPQHSASAADQDQATGEPSSDSHTVLSNEQSTNTNEQSANTTEAGDAQKSSFVEHLTSDQPNEEPRKCWICFSDETEDTPESSVWKTPCPCALTAHESCLLDWVADMERPGSSNVQAYQKEIRCPQCTAEIHLARPKSYIVQSVGAVEKVLDRLRLPTFLIGLTWGLNIICYRHGLHSVRVIFGEEDAQTILAPLSGGQVSVLERKAFEYFPKAAGVFFRDWKGLRTEIGLPLIPVALIGSRTKIADAFLPIVPILFFASHPDPTEAFGGPHWPPSAALTLIILPYVRSIYSEYIERVWGPREKQWLKELEPRHREAEDAEPEAGRRPADHGEEEVVRLEVDLNIGFGVDARNWNEQSNDGDAIPPDIVRPQAAAVDIEQDARQNVEALGQAADDLEGRFREAADRVQRDQELREDALEEQGEQDGSIQTTGARVADTVMGALLFPSISAAMGEGLRLLLPTSLTTPKFWEGRLVATGLLQTRWGRSIVGGCLFVMLKDAVRIYCRWKMAQSFHKRKVLNWDKAKSKLEQA